jgi:serine/threonine protein phosphatase PrpC
MNETAPVTRWRVAGQRVRGAAHERAGTPCQDAIRWEEGPPLLLTLADGHGSARSPRSEAGAELAVQAAVEELQCLWEGPAPPGNLSALKHLAEYKLPQAMVRRWIEAVKEDHSQHAAVLEATEVVGEEDLLLQYGCTLLAVLVAEQFILYLQLGDGDILAAAPDGTVHRPILRDERLIANETTSLCSPQAWREFRVGFQVLGDRPPALILASTDGYANSFRDEAVFLQIGPDYLEMIRSDGFDAVAAGLEEWLTEASTLGSGDDIALGMIYREEEEDSHVPDPSTGPDGPDGNDPPAV